MSNLPSNHCLPPSMSVACNVLLGLGSQIILADWSSVVRTPSDTWESFAMTFIPVISSDAVNKKKIHKLSGKHYWEQKVNQQALIHHKGFMSYSLVTIVIPYPKEK